MGNWFHPHWPNTKPNWSNWAVTLSPASLVTNLSPKVHTINIDKIIISNCFESSSHFKESENVIDTKKLDFLKLFLVLLKKFPLESPTKRAFYMKIFTTNIRKRSVFQPKIHWGWTLPPELILLPFQFLVVTHRIHY